MGQNLGVKKQSAAFHVKGIDSYRFLNGMLTQDIQKTSEHLPSGARSFFLTNKGKIIAPLFFTSLNQEEVFLWTDADSAEALYQGLERYLIADKAEITAAGTFSSWSLIKSEFKSALIKTRHPQGLEKITTTSISDKLIALPLGLLSTEHTELICLKDEFQATEMSKEDYWQVCFNAGQPQWGIDLFADDFF
ncbi:MAG: hypothetical protein R3A80_05620 [Bdellovibrionota bacterium]